MKNTLKKALAGAIALVMMTSAAGCGVSQDTVQKLDEISATVAALQTQVEEVGAALQQRREAEAQRLADEAAAEEARIAEEERLAAEEAAVRLIGERDETKTKIALFNESEYELNEFYIKVPAEGWTDNLIDDIYEIGEKRYLFYDAEGDGYDIWINMVGDWHYTLHDFPFGDIESGELRYDYDNDVMYLTYTSVSTQEEISTLETEAAIHAAELEAARKAAEEAAAAAAAAAAASRQSSGNSNTCLTDGLFW